MKTLIVLIVIISALGCNKTKTASALTTIKISESNVNFGKISVEDTIRYNFLVENTGDQALHIDNVSPSCGCISYDWTKAGVESHNFAYVKVAFKPKKNELGKSSKTVILSTNTKNTFTPLTISYEVLP